MKLDEVIGATRDAIHVRRVYAEPYEKEGVTVIPAASVAGGGGGGQGHGPGEEQGEGAGFGMAARPAGVYVLSEGRLRWRPAVDVNRLVSTVAAVAIVFMITRSRVARARAKAARHG